MKYIIGIDAGTTGVKAALFDLEGNEVLVESRENEPTTIGESMIEQDMLVLKEKVFDCLKSIGRSDKVPKEDILAVGLTGQGEGCWLIDEKGEPVQNATLWCDGRSNEIIAELDEETKRLIHNYTGTPALPGGTLLQLLWNLKRRKEALDKAAYVICAKDWIGYNLTGEITTDYTDMGPSMLDIQTGLPAKELMEKLGLGEYVRLIPTLKNSSELRGVISDSVADLLGLRKGMPVIMGALDVMACALGLGAVNKGDTLTILGTTCCTDIIIDKEDAQKLLGDARVEIHAVDGLYINLMPTMAGTPNLDWAREQIADTPSFAEIEKKLESIPAGSGGVIYHPYLGSAGERAPFYSPNARASFFGLNTATTRYHLIKAVYEGIAFSIKDCLYKYSDSKALSICGGGAKSRVWAQIIADVTGRVVSVHDGTEFGAKGAVMLAGVHLGVFKDYNDASRKLCHIVAAYEPNAKNAKLYDDLYELYLESRIAFMPLWDKRRRIMDANN